jgi:type IV pilus assembly protein PilV
MGKIMVTASRKKIATSQQGVALLEALIAFLIVSFGVLGVIGLQAAMVKNSGDARYRAEASQIAQQRIGAMWMDQAHLADYAEMATDISAQLPSGTRTVAINATNDVTVTVEWQQPGSEEKHRFSTTTRIAGGTL